MAFDGLVTYTITNELKNTIINGKIDKIFQPNPNEILLGIYCNGIKYALDIVVSSNHYRICLTNSAKSNPNFAPNFCMLLRKHLLNTKIVNISTHSLERIVTIEFEGRSKSDDLGNKKLVIELMGKHSNIILLNSKNIIIDALKRFCIESNSYRNIIPNCKYVLPISNKLDIMQLKTKDAFYLETLDYINAHPEIISSTKLSDIISNTYTGISKVSINSIITRSKLENTFSKETMNVVYDNLLQILEKPSHIILELISDNDYSPIVISQNKKNNLQANFFVDDYYCRKESSEIFTNYRDNLSKLLLNYLKKLNHKLSNINRKLEECKNMDLYRLYGELITNNLYRIKENHTNEITIENYYDNNNLITIPLDKKISPSMNAKNYFKKYNKLKNAKSIVEIQKQEAQNEIDYLESIIYEFQLASTISDIDNIYSEFSESFLIQGTQQLNHIRNKKKNHHRKEKQKSAQIGQPIKYQVGEFIVIVGKNNKQNDYITKQANSNDIWFHAKNIHGSHVILKTNNKLPSQDIINKCASIAAFHSKARESSNVTVDYTEIKHVKKPSNAKPGMVIYTNNKSVIVKPHTFNSEISN